MLSKSQAWADQRLANIKADAIDNMTKTLSAERARLKSLQQVNNSIRDEEITHIDTYTTQLHASIERATLSVTIDTPAGKQFGEQLIHALSPARQVLMINMFLCRHPMPA